MCRHVQTRVLKTTRGSICCYRSFLFFSSFRLLTNLPPSTPGASACTVTPRHAIMVTPTRRYRGTFTCCGVNANTTTITWTTTYLTSDAAATTAALEGFVPLMDAAWEALEEVRTTQQTSVAHQRTGEGGEKEREKREMLFVLPLPQSLTLEQARQGETEHLCACMGVGVSGRSRACPINQHAAHSPHPLPPNHSCLRPFS